MACQMSIGIIIPTLGINDCLDESLTSIARQTSQVTAIVVVDQSVGSRIEDVCRRWSDKLPIRHVRSRTGLSHARNIGLEILPNSTDVVGFLDDDCSYGDGCLAEASRHFNDPGVGALSGRLHSSTPRLKFGKSDEKLGRRTVWTKAIEPAMFCRMSAIHQAGPFDEDLGIGSRTPWQSGEGTDLLLRIMKLGYSVWYTPACEIHEHDTNRTTPVNLANKSRKYGRGTGRVYRMHYPWQSCLWQVIRPLLGSCLALASGNMDQYRRRLQAAIGRWEGLSGWIVSRPTEY